MRAEKSVKRRPWCPPAYDPQVVARTPEWVAIHKPPHLLIHPTKPDGTPTLYDWVLANFPGGNPSIVNRLDRETSGLVLVALDSKTAGRLGRMTMARQIQKEYLAIVLGQPPPAGTINQAIARAMRHGLSDIFVKQWVHPEGKPAITHYLTLETRHHPRLGLISLLRVRLESGRLHQIRVHLSWLGYPVLGDKLYGHDDRCYLEFIEHGWTEKLAQCLGPNHHALHAYHMSWTWRGHRTELWCPWPPSLRKIWDEACPHALSGEASFSPKRFSNAAPSKRKADVSGNGSHQSDP